MNRQIACQAHQQKSGAKPTGSGLLQRKCACGNHAMAGGECKECGKKKRLGLQAKLKVNEPGDIYEQEADRVADQVMATPAHQAASGAPPGIQRFSGQPTGQTETAPASVDHALAGPGRPLEPALRQDMEQRFGYDFSRVRVHSGIAAEQAARDVNAHAYTVGHDIVFGAGRFVPGTYEGRLLLAHELTHVVQQSGSCVIRGGQGHDKRRLSSIVLIAPAQRHTPAYLARWAITGNTAKVDSEADRLGQLPGRVKSSALNWVCVSPVFMSAERDPKPPADFDAHYEKYLHLGDTFDISNLRTAHQGTSLKLSLFDKTENNHIVLSVLYPGISTSKDPDQDIKTTAQEGKAPLADFLIGGHQGGGAMFGGSGRFELGKVSADEPAPTFSRAKDSKFPRRCWFTHFGTARAVGCISDSFGKLFASVFLRKGAGIDTTTRMIAPTCTKQFRRPDGTCESIDAMEFVPTGGEAITADHGPFRLSDPNGFHSSSFWNRIGGDL